MGAFFIHDVIGEGFEDYIDYNGKTTSGTLKLGCTWTVGNNLVSSVLDSTHVEGIYGGYAQCQPPCTPQYQSETMVALVKSTDGFNTSGTNQTLTLDAAIAQPQSTPGYKMDLSYFAAGSLLAAPQAGQGTYTNPTFACNLSPGGGYEWSPGTCSSGSVTQVGEHNFPTPHPSKAPSAVYVYTFNSGENIDVCMGYGPCALPTIWCYDGTGKCPL